MSLRIGCDLDGVLADMESELVHQAMELFGDPPSGDDSGDDGFHVESSVAVRPSRLPRLATMALTERQQRQLWRHVEMIEGFWETLHEIEPGVVAELASLAAERRWELIFLTKRPETAGATTQVQTQRWLQAHGFPMPSVFVVQGSRGRVAAAFDLHAVVDDRPENCLDVVLDSTSRAFLVWRHDESRLPVTAKRPGVRVVSSMAECLLRLEEMDRPSRDRSSVVRWLKSWFGYNGSSDEP